VGHDLRTPISAILTGADYLRAAAPSAAARQQVALIEDAGLMMKALLDDLLDHARLNAGRMHVESNEFDLRLLLAQTARLWQGQARAQGLRLRLEGARETPRWVRGDAMRLRQVLNNLISNAMKFTEAGTVTLKARCWVDDQGACALLIDIADTGRGMSPAQLQRRFNPFDQFRRRHGPRAAAAAVHSVRPDPGRRRRPLRRFWPGAGDQPRPDRTDGRAPDGAQRTRLRLPVHRGPEPASGTPRCGRRRHPRRADHPAGRVRPPRPARPPAGQRSGGPAFAAPAFAVPAFAAGLREGRAR